MTTATAKQDAAAKKMEAVLETTLGDLHHLKSVLQLCAFACEARKTLTELEDLMLVFPEHSELLNRQMGSRREWIEHEDTTSLVLKEVSYQVGLIVDRIGRVI
jgi:hypothetical protein